MMLIDGKESGEYDSLMVGITFQGESAGCRSPFSPDGRRVSLRGRAGGFVVCRRGWAARQAVQRYA